MNYLDKIKEKLEFHSEKIKFTDQETRDKRFAICLECEYLIKATSTCKKCGCFMTLKTKLKNVTCPIEKW